jgi:hypothetical protein
VFPLIFHVDFDSKSQTLRARAEGRVTDKELKDFYTSGFRWVALLKPRAAITDLSSVTSFDVSHDTIRELARSESIFPDPHLPRVIIAPSSQVFGMARMFEIQGEGSRPALHVVRTEQEAYAVLGILQPQFEPVPRELPQRDELAP